MTVSPDNPDYWEEFDRLARGVRRNEWMGWLMVAVSIGLIAFEAWWPTFTPVPPWLTGVSIVVCSVCFACNVMCLRSIRRRRAVVLRLREEVIRLGESR